MACLGSRLGHKGSSQRLVTPNTMAKSSSSPAKVKEKEKPKVLPVASLKCVIPVYSGNIPALQHRYPVLS